MTAPIVQPKTYMRPPDGGPVVPVPQDQIAQAVAEGAEVVGPEEFRTQELDREYGGLGGAAMATGAGLARGLSVGLSDPLAIGAARAFGGKSAGESTRKALGELKEAQPVLSAGSQLLGAVAPIAFSGGGAALAEGGAAAAEGGGLLARAANLVGAAPRAVAAAGRLAEGAATLGGERAMALGLGARIIQRSAPAAVGGATEGALWGAGDEISDAAIDNHELTAERLWAAAGKGALMGGATGGLLGAGGEILSTGARSALGTLKGESIADYAERKSGEAAFRAAGGTKKMAEGADAWAGGYHNVGRIARDELPGFVGKENFRQLTPEEIALGAGRGAAKRGEELGDLLRQVDEAAARPMPPEGASGLGGTRRSSVDYTVPRPSSWDQTHLYREGVPLSAEERAYGAAREGPAAKRIDPEFVSESAPGQRPMNDNMGSMPPPPPKYAFPRAADVVGDIESVQAKLTGHVGTESVQSKLESLIKSVKKVTGMVDETGELVPHAGDIGITFTQLRNIRADVDNAWAGNNMNPELIGFKKEFYKVRDILEKRLVDGADAVAQANGIDFRAPYEKAKMEYQAFKMLAKAAKSGSSKGGANQVFGLGDKIIGSSMGGWGAHIGGAVAGAPGAFIGGALGGLGGALLNKGIRERGNFFAADILHRVSQLAAIEKINADVDRKIAQGIRSFLIPGESKLGSDDHKRRGARDTDTLAAAKGVLSAQNPAILQDRIERAVGPLGDYAPGITRALGTKAAVSMAFLASKAPALRHDVTSLTPQFEKPRTSDAEIRKFAQYLEGTEDPLSMIRDMRRNRLTREKVEAVKATSPLFFSQVRQQVLDAAPRLKSKMSYEKRLQLSVLFGAPMDDTLEGGFILAMQGSKGPPPPPAKEGAKGGRHKNVKIDKTMFATPSEQIAT